MMTKGKDAPATTGPLDKSFLPIERRLLHLSAGGQRGFLLLRLMLAATLFVQAFAAASEHGKTAWTQTIVLVYAAAAIVLYRLRQTKKLSDDLGPGTFMLDVGTSLAVLRLTEGSGSHVYTAMLLLIIGSPLLKKTALIFAVSLTVCLAYAFLAFPSAEDISHVFPLHLSLFLLIALFSVHLADYASEIERQTARRYEERLAWMQRLSLVGKAMAAVLHEAKTPIATIVLNAESAVEMLRKGQKPSAELRVITEEADQATSILQNFLDFVKPTELDLKPLLAHEPLLQAISMLKIRLDERGVEIALKTLEDCSILGSPRYLIQAFTNILNNAVDAMPSGGKLSVRMEKRDRKALIHFDDNGVGMTPAALESLFEPFSTSKSGEQGHGLGLSIVLWIAQEHGGDIQIHSQGPGTGSQAVLSLPLADKS